MARKQATPAPVVEDKDPTTATETSAGQVDGDNLAIPEGVLVPPNNDESGGRPVPTPAEGAGQGLPADQRGPIPEWGSEAVVLAAEPGAPGAEASDGESSGHSALMATEAGSDTDEPATGEEVAVSLNPVTLQIYPMRSYMDEGGLRRRGGPAYTVPRRHAEELVRRKLASLEPLKD